MHLFVKFKYYTRQDIVFKPGPVAARIPGFDRVTGSIPILKKIQNGVVLVKKQKSTGRNRVLLGQPGRRVGWVTPGHDFFYFFINPARFQPRVDLSGWAGSQNYKTRSKFIDFNHLHLK